MRQVSLWPFLAGLLLCLACAHAPLAERARFDAGNTRLLVAVDLDEVATVARAVGRAPEDELARLAAVGVNACVTTTHTLAELAELGEVAVDSPAPGARSTRITLRDRADPYRVRQFLERLQPSSRVGPGVTGPPTADRGEPTFTLAAGGPLVMEMRAFRDRRLEGRARQFEMTPIYRLNNSPWAGPSYIQALTADLPQHALVVFDEKQALGWPSNTEAALDALREKKAAVCIVEFAGQVGVREMAAQGSLPCVLLHSIGRPEMAKLNLARILPRWIRAAGERNTRVMVAHMFPATNLPYPGLDISDSNVRYLRETVGALREAGFCTAAPSLRHGHGAAPRFESGRAAARAGIGAAVWLLVAWLLVLLDLLPARLALLVAAPLWPAATVLFVLKPIGGAKLVAMALGVLTPAAATLLVYRGVLGSRAGATPARIVLESAGRALAMLSVCLTGGLLLAATLTSEIFVFRLEEFMGVKLVYLSGPAAAVIGYMWLHRVNPLARPLRVRDVALLGAVALAGVLYILRSGNFISVSATNSAEYAVRDAIQGFVAVRPRTKELLGYPALVLLGFAHAWRDRLWTPFLLLGASISAVSAVNSFCHIHSPPLLSAARGAIALPAGVVLGVLAVPLFALLLHVPRRPLVTVSGYLGFGNFGDELILANLARLVRETLGVRVTLAPYMRRGAPAPEGALALDRGSPAAMVSGLRQSVAHVSLGGGLFQDRTGRASSLYYAAYLVLARLLLVPRVLVVAQSVAVKRRWIADLVARALAAADLVMTRDRASAGALERWGLAPVVGADLASWYPPDPVSARARPRALGISLRPVPGAGPAEAKGGPAGVGLALEALARLARERGLTVVLLALEPDQDHPVMEAAAPMFHGVEHRIVDLTVENHRDVVEGLDLVVATRYHAMMLAFLAELPLFALSYDAKTEDLLDEALEGEVYPHRWRIGAEAGGLDARLAAWAGDAASSRALAARAGAVYRRRGEQARERARAELAGLAEDLAASESDEVRPPVTIAETTGGSSA